MTSPGLRGVRFAPSPTGRFHLGNLRTAWISERLARALGEPWVVRFEDIDGPRVIAGAQEMQLEDMRALGLEPDEIAVQSRRFERHAALFALARRGGHVYPCDCSRKTLQADLASMASAPHGEAPAYSGRCRRKADAEAGSAGFVSGFFSEPAEPEPLHAIDAGGGAEHVGWRFRSADASGRDDFLVGRSFSEDVEASFQPSYHWACAIDDSDGRYRLLVRAHDLASAAKRQRAIQKWLATEEGEDALARTPALFHASLVVQDDGHRLEKRTRGVTLDELAAQGISPALLRAAFEQSFLAPSRADLMRLGPGGIAGEAREVRPIAEVLAAAAGRKA